MRPFIAWALDANELKKQWHAAPPHCLRTRPLCNAAAGHTAARAAARRPFVPSLCSFPRIPSSPPSLTSSPAITIGCCCGLRRHNFILINAMLLSLLRSLAAYATGVAEPLIASALLVDDVLIRRWHFFLQEQALSRVQQRCSKPPQTFSTPSPSILHTCPSFHTRHFHYRHPYARLQHRLRHSSRTNPTYHMT